PFPPNSAAAITAKDRPEKRPRFPLTSQSPGGPHGNERTDPRFGTTTRSLCPRRTYGPCPESHQELRTGGNRRVADSDAPGRSGGDHGPANQADPWPG